MIKNSLEKMLDIFLNALTQIVAWLGQHGLNIALILLGAWLLHRYGARLLSKIISHTVRPDLYPSRIDREKRLKTISSLAGAIVKSAVWVIATILIIGELNPAYATALFAGAGLVTVALGFGAKNLINDLISGIFIITENQYRVGDVVEIAGVNGVIEDVTIRTTVLRDLDGHVHHVPNGSITVTTNKTLGYSGVNEDIVFEFDTDIDRLTHVINHVGERLAAKPEFKDKITEPPHFDSFTDFGVAGIVVKVVAKTGAGDQWAVKSELNRMLFKAFKANDLHVANQTLLAKKPIRSSANTTKPRTAE